MNLNVDSMCAIVALLISGYAAWQTHTQIKLSNKQHLFDKRMKLFLRANSILELYEKHQKMLVKEENTQIQSDIMLIYFTNNSYLEEMEKVIETPLENPNHKQFLLKLEEIKELANSLTLIFRKKEVKFLSEFIYNYQLLLFEIYKYQIVNNNMQKWNEENPTPYEKLQKQFGEKEHREKLYKIFDVIKSSYDQIVENKAMDKIKQQINIS